MSTQDDTASVVEEYSTLFTGNYAGYAALTLLVYDYLLTFPAEVNLFWKRRRTGAAVLFFANRYLSLLYNIADNTNEFGISTSASCYRWIKTTVVIGLLVYTTWAGVSGLRAYALSRNYVFSSLVFLLYMVATGVNAVQLHSITGVVVPQFGCLGSDSSSLRAVTGFVITSRSSFIIADTLLVAITWATLYRSGESFRKHSLVYVLVRDGTIYFICLLVMNVLHLVLTLLSLATVAGEDTSDVTIFTDPLTSVLISRFLLSLQAVDSRAVCLDSQMSTQGGEESRVNSTLVFNERIIGSLGSSIVHDARTTEDDEDDVEAIEEKEPGRSTELGDISQESAPSGGSGQAMENIAGSTIAVPER